MTLDEPPVAQRYFLTMTAYVHRKESKLESKFLVLVRQKNIAWKTNIMQEFTKQERILVNNGVMKLLVAVAGTFFLKHGRSIILTVDWNYVAVVFVKPIPG